jgi:hypothetical protein
MKRSHSCCTKSQISSHKKKENNQLDVGDEDHELYAFGFAQIPIHIMSRVSMWGLSSHDRTKKRKKKHSFPKSFFFFHSWFFLWNV